jgi:hypothetical protein
MKTNSKLAFAMMVGASMGVMGEMVIRGEQAKTAPAM